MIIMKNKYLVEMFDTNGQVSTEEWEFNTKTEAKKFYNQCKSQYMEPADKKHIRWLLSKIDKEGNYQLIEEFSYC